MCISLWAIVQLPQAKCPKHNMVIRRNHQETSPETMAVTNTKVREAVSTWCQHSEASLGTKRRDQWQWQGISSVWPSMACLLYVIWCALVKHRINNFIFITFPLSWCLRIMCPVPTMLNFWHSLSCISSLYLKHLLFNLPPIPVLDTQIPSLSLVLSLPFPSHANLPSLNFFF